MSGISEAQFQQLQRNVVAGGGSAPVQRRTAVRKETAARVMADGPLDVTLVLHGHCPSKKNGWQRGESGKMYIPTEMAKEIEGLTTQAMFYWRQPGPVEHPDVHVTFFVAGEKTRVGERRHPKDKNKTVSYFRASGTQDEDGMWTTILDCLQKAGVIVNDNIAHFNGRKVHEPCQFVEAASERVEIRIVKK